MAVLQIRLKLKGDHKNGREKTTSIKQSKFATAISCIDGRVQKPFTEWMKSHLNVQYVDMVTEPGPDKALTQGPVEVVESIRRKVLVSITAHYSSVIAVVAHHDCAGNPVSKEEHLAQIKKCVEIVASWRLPVRILGLWVNNQWEIEIIYDTERYGFN